MLCVCIADVNPSIHAVLRTHNIYGNRAAPSRDIATTFAIQEQLRFICSGGVLSGADRLVSGHEMKNGHINIVSSIQKHVHYILYLHKYAFVCICIYTIFVNLLCISAEFEQ